ncbi:hypothetical protein VOLCADRAFT_103133 [Volvox carteri f. nagariensis]|uniref:Uncharacterized protein n=1 Tax=Volvox carteri f. nagariensis TaxID=3068 RepID=D8TKT3_VOLCA|nr:uncharacterized protein VOLCADRAFT_103133 [Volvox carteri f. nagariensis]EFJ52120.1 hypothetical protein VOLCADRAFT_103133 [Volvox carteri f. nagariensis]|eukprot:XP_002946894.1 hypothetical protein VOLCADRAFT_103133 [Volvox carteri f. nagariensis]
MPMSIVQGNGGGYPGAVLPILLGRTRATEGVTNGQPGVEGTPVDVTLLGPSTPAGESDTFAVTTSPPSRGAGVATGVLAAPAAVEPGKSAPRPLANTPGTTPAASATPEATKGRSVPLAAVVGAVSALGAVVILAVLALVIIRRRRMARRVAPVYLSPYEIPDPSLLDDPRNGGA